MNVHARVLFQPRADRGMLVRGVVVDDQMQGQSSQSLPVQLFKKAQPFDFGMARCGRAQDLLLELVEGGEQRDGAMAGVVMGPDADVAHPQRQPRLGAWHGDWFQGLVDWQGWYTFETKAGEMCWPAPRTGAEALAAGAGPSAKE